jgi:hypothetical protein
MHYMLAGSWSGGFVSCIYFLLISSRIQSTCLRGVCSLYYYVYILCLENKI